MADDSAKHAPPYVGYSALMNFIDGLREAGIPDRVDPSLFGNISGGQKYGILSALKFLRLIEQEGAPRDGLRTLVAAEEKARPPLIREILKQAYPSLWDGSINLETATSGQFDEHLRERYEIKGSMIDRAAAFFIAAASDAGVPISLHLKKRKPIASGAAARKNSKNRRAASDLDTGSVSPPPPLPPPALPEKGPVEVLVSILDMSEMNDQEQDAVWTLIRYLKAREAKKKSATAP